MVNTIIRLSPGIIASSLYLFDLLDKYIVTQSELRREFITISGTKTEDVLETCFECQWILSDIENIKVSARARELIQLSFIETEREMIKDFLLINKPSWITLFTKGRLESVPFLPRDIQACFFDAKLMEQTPDTTATLWWDNLLVKIYNEREAEQLLTGRFGERLSIEYEIKRTKQHPIWKSIDSNLAGYDLLSQVSKYDVTKLLIEVKASISDYLHAVAHITRNEWETACLSSNYCFHLWLISEAPQIAIISFDDMKIHIPEDSGYGSWESVAIPYKSFDTNLWQCFYDNNFSDIHSLIKLE